MIGQKEKDFLTYNFHSIRILRFAFYIFSKILEENNLQVGGLNMAFKKIRYLFELIPLRKLVYGLHTKFSCARRITNKNKIWK